MAISAPTKSTAYLAYEAGASPSLSGPFYLLSGNLIFTAAGFTTAAAGDLSLLRIPKGRWRIDLDLSQLTCPAGTATSDLDIGLGAYTEPDGSVIEADGDSLAASLDVGGGALDTSLGAGSAIVDSRDGVDVVASFDTANSPASGTLTLKLALQPA